MAHRLMSRISAVLVLAWAPAASAQFSVPDVWGAAGVTGIVDEADQKIVRRPWSDSVS